MYKSADAGGRNGRQSDPVPCYKPRLSASSLLFALLSCDGAPPSLEPDEPRETASPADSATDTSAPPVEGRDVVVVVIDTARHTLFREGSFPLLSARAAAAETVENMTGTAGWTGPAVTSMMTGFRVEERQARGGVEALSDAEVETLAETLQGHGWHTYLNSANLVLTTSLSQGFDEQVFSDKTVETTGALLEAHDEPVFAWVQLMELHIPFGPMADSCEAEVTAAAALCPVELYDIGDAVNYGHIDFEALAAEEQLACGEAIHAGQSCAATRLDVELDAFLSALPPATLVLVSPPSPTTHAGARWAAPLRGWEPPSCHPRGSARRRR